MGVSQGYWEFRLYLTWISAGKDLSVVMYASLANGFLESLYNPHVTQGLGFRFGFLFII